MQKELDERDWSCAEAVPLQKWVNLFKQDKLLETDDNAELISDLLVTVAKIQDLVIHRLGVDFDQLNQLLSTADEFVRLLNVPVYQSAIKQLRQGIEGILGTATQNAALAQKEADRKFAHIEARRRMLEQQEEEAQRYLKESLSNMQDSIERGVLAAMRQAKGALPDIGLADSRL